MTSFTDSKAYLSQSEPQPNTGKTTMSPETHVTTLLRSLDISSRDIDKIRQGHDKWPRWCFAPFTVWATSFVRSRQDLRKINDITSAITVIPWRYSRSVYRFDPDLYRELVATPFSGEIPEEVLLRLPEWSIFVEMQGESVSGFFSSLEYVSPGKAELRFVFCTEERLMPFYIALSAGTIEKSFEDCLREYEAVAGESDKVKAEYTEVLGEDLSLVKKALSLVLYVCSDEAEIRDREAPDWEPAFPRAKVTKGEERLFPADRNRVVDVGRELGAMLREGATKSEPSAPTGRTVRPHMRRGHWHGFWTGPRKENRDQQKFVLKWLPPLFVHGKNV